MTAKQNGTAPKQKYSIKKISNGEYKEIDKKLKLNVSKYCGNRSNLYFDVEGDDLPVIFDVNLFYSILVEQIQKGLVEHLIYNNDGVITMTIRDGNIIKNYTYDFSFHDFESKITALDEVKTLVYKIISMFSENPNKAMSTEQRYLRMIFDIIDGVRLPQFEDPYEILRIFEVYNGLKPAILLTLLENVVFFDDEGNVMEYGKHLKAQKLKAIKYDVLNQMEVAMLQFAVNNNSFDLYRAYNQSIYIPRREIAYKFVDADGNEVQPATEIEKHTLLTEARASLKKRLLNLKDLVVATKNNVQEKISERKRTK
jgi:hypothetical protein